MAHLSYFFTTNTRSPQKAIILQDWKPDGIYGIRIWLNSPLFFRHLKAEYTSSFSTTWKWQPLPLKFLVNQHSNNSHFIFWNIPVWTPMSSPIPKMSFFSFQLYVFLMQMSFWYSLPLASNDTGPSHIHFYTNSKGIIPTVGVHMQDQTPTDP